MITLFNLQKLATIWRPTCWPAISAKVQSLNLVWLVSITLALSFKLSAQNAPIIVGAEQLDLYLNDIKGKRVGLVVNQTSVVGNQHLLDVLLKQNINVTHLFAPEHGVRGNYSDGAKINSSVEDKTGIPIVSIYGKSKRPPAEIIEKLDVIVFDIQDVGARFYTYINSMFYMMQAAQNQSVQFIVLDRPNPNMAMTDGPVLEDKQRSFVGLFPIPMMYGMTIGELANMINGEGWLQSIQPINSTVAQNKAAAKLDLKVIPVKNYNRQSIYHLPIPPSPNLPNAQAVALYPSLVLFEATPISIGRGTDFPFQVIGYHSLASNKKPFEFKPRSIPGVSKYPKLEGKNLFGERLALIVDEPHKLIDFSYLNKWHRLFQEHNETFFTRAAFFDKLAGTDKFRKALQDGKSVAEIRRCWEPSLKKFKAQRTPYLIYH